MSYLFVLAAIVMRLLPHPWNLTPLGAMFLFSGATFRSKRDSLLVPLAALLISDYAVIHFIYREQYAWFSPFTWAGFLLVGLLGWTLRDKRSVRRVVGASLAGSLIFFLVSNFGVWVGWKLYAPTFAGLVNCYVAGLPFLRNTLVGDIAYAGLLFGTYAWVRQRYSAVASGA
jgi:hypothetical protein